MRRDRTPDFTGRVVAITGASSGLGAALAEAFAAAGANPALLARSPDGLAATAERCRAFGADPLVVPGDVTRSEDCQALVAQAVERFGRLDVALHCAGVGMWARFEDIERPEVMHRLMDVNYWGLVNLAWAALPQLKADAGVLTAVSSLQGRVGVPYHTGYAAAKHAVQGFCDSLRIELRGTGVDVLTVLAHWIRGTGLRQSALGPDGRPRGDAAPGHGSDAIAAGDAADRILRAVQSRRRELYLPGWVHWLAMLSAVAPGLTDRLVAGRVDREAGRH